MSGVVKGITFDQKKNRSLLHMQAAASSMTMRNRILVYVYNLFGERETIVPGKKPVTPPRERSSDGIILKAAAPAPKPGSGEAGS
jgi:hypothetical protein